jgi:hypothetical protein
MLKRETLEFQLEDIMEEIKFKKDGTAINDEKVIEENIIEILKREKLWKRGYSICFPCGADGYLDVGNTEDDPSTYQYDYEIFASDHNTVLASGTCYGSLLVYRKSNDPELEDGEGEVTSVEVLDMDLEICDYEPKFAQKPTDKEVVNFD